MPTQFPLISQVPATFNLATYNGILPNKVTLTGTWTSSGVNVTGTSTLFTTELQQPSYSGAKYYLYNSTTGEIRSVKNIIDDTHLTLNVAFASNLSGATIYGVTPSLGNYPAIKLFSAAACTIGLLDQAVITTIASVEWIMRGDAINPIEAIHVAGASGTLYIGNV